MITDYMFNYHRKCKHPSSVSKPRRKSPKKKPIPRVSATRDTSITDSIRTQSEDYDNIIGSNLSRETFSTGAVRRKTDDSRLDLIPLEALEGYGRRLHFGATVRGYGERNWEKGITYANLIQHCQRHLSKLAAQLISQREGTFAKQNPSITDYQVDSNGNDTAYGNACALLWNSAAIVTFLARGNPAEGKK
jgi:hypothetical protein